MRGGDLFVPKLGCISICQLHRPLTITFGGSPSSLFSLTSLASDAMLQPTNVQLPSSDLPTVHDEIEMGRGFNRKPLTKVAGEFHGGAAAWCSHLAAVASHLAEQSDCPCCCRFQED